MVCREGAGYHHMAGDTWGRSDLNNFYNLESDRKNATASTPAVKMVAKKLTYGQISVLGKSLLLLHKVHTYPQLIIITNYSPLPPRRTHSPHKRNTLPPLPHPLLPHPRTPHSLLRRPLRQRILPLQRSHCFTLGSRLRQVWP